MVCKIFLGISVGFFFSRNAALPPAIAYKPYNRKWRQHQV